MTTAFETFKKSKNETVAAQISQFDAKAEEDKVGRQILTKSLVLARWF
jgi:hypothetical protein